MRLYYQAKNNYEQKKYNKLINYAFWQNMLCQSMLEVSCSLLPAVPKYKC